MLIGAPAMDTQLLSTIALGVIAPVLVMAGVGFLLGWFRVVEPGPIAKLYMNIFAPALALVNVVDARLTGEQFGQVVIFNMVCLAALLVLTRAASAALGHDRAMRGTFANSVVLYNSANYGLPVQELAFPKAEAVDGVHGSVIQPIVLIVQSATAFSLGPFNAASNAPGLLATLRRMALMPMIWALVLGMMLRSAGVTVEHLQTHVPMIWTPITYFQAALVPVALLSLGVQLSRVRIHGKVLNIALGSSLRLLVGPLVGLAVGLAMRWLGGLVGTGPLAGLLSVSDPLLAILIVSISFPTAVFTSVLATNFRNHEDYAAATVFVSTVGSIITVTAVIYLTKTALWPMP